MFRFLFALLLLLLLLVIGTSFSGCANSSITSEVADRKEVLAPMRRPGGFIDEAKPLAWQMPEVPEEKKRQMVGFGEPCEPYLFVTKGQTSERQNRLYKVDGRRTYVVHYEKQRKFGRSVWVEVGSHPADCPSNCRYCLQ